MTVALKILRNYGIALSTVAVLSWFPVTGFFLTLITFGVLPALIVNALLIHLAIAAAAGKIPRQWLAAPILCYGAWFGWIGWRNFQYVAIERELEAENHISEAVGPDVALVFPDRDELAVRVKRWMAGPRRVFAGSVELGPIGRHEIICSLAGPHAFIPCPVEPPSAPPTKTLAFRQIEAPALRADRRFHRYELTLASGDGEKVAGHFNFGSISLPIPAPVFLAGCFLIDEPPEWRCDASPLMRQTRFGGTGYGWPNDDAHTLSDPAVGTLAKMLGVDYLGKDARP